MKKLFISLLLPSVLLFSATNSEIEKKLDMIIERMNKMQKQLNSKDVEIKKLKKEVKKQNIETKKEFMIKSCDKLKVTNFNYKYHNNVIEFYDLSYNITNNYPYTITKFMGRLTIKDSDDTVILTDFLEKKQTFKKNQTIHISKTHPLYGELDKELKNENPSNINVTFSPTAIKFSNGKTINCGGLIGVNF